LPHYALILYVIFQREDIFTFYNND